MLPEGDHEPVLPGWHRLQPKPAGRQAAHARTGNTRSLSRTLLGTAYKVYLVLDQACWPLHLHKVHILLLQEIVEFCSVYADFATSPPTRKKVISNHANY